MEKEFKIRKIAPRDTASVEALYAVAFPEEDLLPLVRDLLRLVPGTLSLAGIINTSLAGHILFTPCRIEKTASKLALLGPLAVAPAWQRKGVGGSLVRAGLEQLEKTGVAQVFVLGDPAFYGRLGFVAETDIMPPYPLPAEWREAWQTICLNAAQTPHHGKLSVPQPWLRSSLWAP